MDRIHKAVTAKPPDLETVRQLRDGDGIYSCIWLEPGLVVTIIESKIGWECVRPQWVRSCLWTGAGNVK